MEGWTISKVQAYAAQQVETERGRCAKICEELIAEKNPTFKKHENTYMIGWLDAANHAYWAICSSTPYGD